MKSIFLKRLEILNFKGIQELTIDFDKITNIYGENALGKTSIFDAFTWLMFDKDSKNRSSFDVKPLDSTNTVIRGLNPTVVAVLDMNGTEMKLAKTLEEKWTKKRGEAEKIFTGNITTYEINDVPVKQSDYKKKIAEIAEEEQFKLLTNPYYFSDSLNWKDARKLILEVAGDVTIGQVIESNKDLEVIREELEKEDVDTILKSKKASIKKLSDKKKEIPTRINECDRSFIDIDFKAKEEELENKSTLLQNIEEEILDRSKVNEEILKNKEKIFKIKSKIQEINQKAISAGNSKKIDLMTQLGSLESDLKKLEMNRDRLISDKKFKERSKETLEKEMTELRDRFNIVRSQAISLESIETECPTCKRAFEKEDIETKKHELLENFNKNQAKVLRDIQKKGISKKEEVEKLGPIIVDIDKQILNITSDIESKIQEISNMKIRIEEFKVEASYSVLDRENIGKLNSELQELETITEIPIDSNVDNLKEKKKLLLNEINELNKILAKKDLNKNLELRKQELLEEEKELGVEIAKQEKVVMLCEEFIKARVNLLESNINNKFSNVTFKLFDIQVNGGINETCEALINGVPFGNTNTAGQINAGLDIISTLSKHFKVQVPIFIDNRESVNKLIEIDSQVINLIVTKDNPLKIEKYSIEGAI